MIRGLKFKYLLLSCFLLVLGLNFFASNFSISKVYANDENLVVCAYGDSIAYGETLADLTKAYPALFAGNYVENTNTQFTNYGVSGDTSTDLLGKLNVEGVDAEADIVTLCIGANNILGTSFSYLGSYLTDSTNTTKTAYEQALDAGVANFRNDYPAILEKLAGKKVVVMTVYNPYKYTSLMDIDISGIPSNYQGMVAGSISGYDAKFQEMLGMSMTSLEEINNIIRQSANEDIVVVDIWTYFNGLTEEEYKDYINADLSKIVSNTADLMPLMQGNFSNLLTKVVDNADPHPTQLGHAYIAEQHKQSYNPFKIISTVPNEVTSSDYVTFNVDYIEDSTVVYRLYKNGILLFESNTKDISVESSLLVGENNYYVKVIKDGNVVYTTETVTLNITLTDATAPSDPSLPTKPKEPSQVLIKIKEIFVKYNLVIVLFVSISLIGIILIFRFILKINNKYIKWK